MEYLKGNYDLKKKLTVKERPKDSSAAFERFAREKLGGSIAFVMKAKTFVWNGPESRPAPTNNATGSNERS